MVAQTPIQKVFIANRGEIARRVAQSCRRLGVKSVAIIHQQRPPDYLVGCADEFVVLPDGGAALFLDGDRMIKAATAAGADALHPGFGFLSENAEFAQKVQAAGLVWIGPAPESIAMMAAKDEARNLAQQHSVPCIPGLEDLATTDLGAAAQQVAAFGERVGFPLLVKAAMGGGGKGMRRIDAGDDVAASLERAASEAESSFGSGKLIVEKLLINPRHIEIQVFGDHHGNAVTLSERDCSVQRRHQKIIEEAPALGLEPAIRDGLHQAALAIARAAQYASAGTVEFLVARDPKTGSQEFYFLEMNTRLQVEHPVTEEILGIDLVAWQIRVASNEALTAEVSAAPAKGHSIEVRLYAEDPAADFLPAPGAVDAFLPASGLGVRWELGLDAIDEISPLYDPMIAKLVVTAADRPEAIRKLRQTLEASMIAGVANNQSYLLAITQTPEFQEGQPGTQFIADHHQDLLKAIAATATTSRQKLLTTAQELAFRMFPEAIPQDSYRIPRLTSQVFSRTKLIHQWRQTNHYAAHAGKYDLVSGQLQTDLGWLPWVLTKSPQKSRLTVGHGSGRCTIDIGDWTRGAGSSSGHSSDAIVAPVPGKITKILSKKGSMVTKDQTVIILESMKMEFEVKATKTGIIEEIMVTAGLQVEADQVIARWAETPPPPPTK